MRPTPGWLPSALRYDDYDGDYARFVQDAYAIFERDFKSSRPFLLGLPVVYDSRIDRGKEQAFWHVTSAFDRHTGKRIPDMRRVERVSWIRPVLEHHSDPPVSGWRNRRGSKKNLLLWLEEWDFLVVLQEKSRCYVLVTAYVTDREHTRRKLREERDLSSKLQAPPPKGDGASTPPTRGR